MLPVRQKFTDRAIKDIPAEVHKQLGQAPFAAKVKPGGRIALGVGSRGIANIATIVRSAVDYWKSAGFEPFIFPAMGSHGAATAEGQADVLAHYGIHEATMNCPVVSSLEVVSLGSTSEGIEAFMDRNAFMSDGVMLIGRVKWHTDFAGKIESGLFKMMAIGLGKFAGAQRYHTYAYKLGLENIIRTIGRQVLASGKIVGGLAILEDANHNTAQLTAVPVDRMEQQEEDLLALAKSWMGKVPVPELDILMLDEIGKPISGAGMDTKVINRSVYGEANLWPDTPRIERVFVRDLHPNTYGNAVGLGMADVVHDRLVEKVDWHPTMINSFTASSPQCIRTPVHFASDRECLLRLMPTVGRVDPADVTLCWMTNTLDLTMVKLSENLRDQIERDSMLEVLGAPEELEFDELGNLPKLSFVEDPAMAGSLHTHA